MKVIKEIVNKMLPSEGEKIILDNIKFDELIKVKFCCMDEGFEKFTCRPVHKIDKDERTERYKEKLAGDKNCILGIYDKESKKIAGHISIFDYNPRNRSVEMGYYLIKEFRNKGFMTEAVNIFNKILFAEVQLNKVTAQTGSYNKESNALLLNCGFKLEGCLREHHELNGKLFNDNIYSILKKEFKN